MTGRFAVVIPTLQRSPLLAALLDAVCADPLVHEVVVVNNAPADLHPNDARVRVISPGRNLLVNRSWNLGVQESSAPLLWIANDDIVLPDGLLAAVAQRLRQGAGIVGPSPISVGPLAATGRRVGRIRFAPIAFRRPGFGTAMFLRRENWHPIPADLQLWCGDDYLFSRQRELNYEFSGVSLGTMMALTSRAPEFTAIKQQDLATFAERYPDSPYRDHHRALVATHRAARAVLRRLPRGR